MSEPALEIRGLMRRYETAQGGLTIIDGADAVVRTGEIVGLIGPSGSGKSSLLHAAGLLERPTAGKVLIAGQDAWSLDDKKRTALRRKAIGFVYQFHHLLPEFDARDNVAMPQLIAGVSEAKARAEAERLLDALGLSHRLDHRPAEMSGGEQQRVAIARALANKPQVLLADEPTGNLDPATSKAVFDALFGLVRAEGVAALVATHNLELARFMDRVLTLKDGKLVPG